MAHTYVVTSSTYQPGVPGPDPMVSIVGTVDGVDGSIQVWLSAIQQVFQAAGGGVAGRQAVMNFVAPLMLAQAIANQPPAPTPVVQLPTGTFTQ